MKFREKIQPAFPVVCAVIPEAVSPSRSRSVCLFSKSCRFMCYLYLGKHPSIGLRNGDYGGKYTGECLEPSKASCISSVFCIEPLSMTINCSGAFTWSRRCKISWMRFTKIRHSYCRNVLWTWLAHKTRWRQSPWYFFPVVLKVQRMVRLVAEQPPWRLPPFGWGAYLSASPYP